MALNTAADVKAEIDRLQARKVTLEREIAVGYEGDTSALTTEYVTLIPKLAAATLLLQAAEHEEAGRAREALLARYRALLTRQHAGYTRRAEIDADFAEKQKALDALNAEYAKLETETRTESGRRAKLAAEAQSLGITSAELDAIRKEFAPIPKYW